MLDYLKIEVSGLDAIYPTGYVDRMYTVEEVTQAGIHEEVFKTSQKFRTVTDSIYKERVIQAILLDKYKLVIYGNRARNLGLMRTADTINITLKNETVHQAKVIELDEEEVQGTELIRYTLTYADTNFNNYRNGEFPASNPLLSSNLSVPYNYFFLSGAVDAEMSALGNLKFFYTIIEPFKVIADYEETAEKVDGLNVNFNDVVQRAVKCYLYLNEEDKNIFEKYARISPTVQFVSASLGNFRAIEPVKISVSEIQGGVDIYECEVILKYENLNFYRYNT